MYLNPEARKRFDELQELTDLIQPVVSTRYGYAAFIAYIFKVETGPTTPSEWYVGEIDKDRNITAVKRICQY